MDNRQKSLSAAAAGRRAVGPDTHRISAQADIKSNAIRDSLVLPQLCCAGSGELPKERIRVGRGVGLEPVSSAILGSGALLEEHRVQLQRGSCHKINRTFGLQRQVSEARRGRQLNLRSRVRSDRNKRGARCNSGRSNCHLEFSSNGGHVPHFLESPSQNKLLEASQTRGVLSNDPAMFRQLSPQSLKYAVTSMWGHCGYAINGTSFHASPPAENAPGSFMGKFAGSVTVQHSQWSSH